MVERYFGSLDKKYTPVQFSANFFEMENGDVAMTLEKFPRAHERGGKNVSKKSQCKGEEGKRITDRTVEAAE